MRLGGIFMPPWAHVPVGVGRVWAWRTSTGRGKAWSCQGAGPEGDRRKTEKLWVEVELDLAHSAMAVLSHD